MDDLVHHCLRELSFDGDLGCNVSRLKDFIVDFYARPEATHTQSLDEAFFAFVWSLVVQQPTVRVGTIPETLTSEVWIAPQTSKRNKAKAKGEEIAETKPPELDLVPDIQGRSLESLVEEFGNKLRIAVEPNVIYAAITGSHIRFAKLSPMVYSALQIVTRGRDDGVSVVSLGQQSGYDQKTCFYLTQQLQELNLVVKVRKPGVGSNWVIHRHFFDKSPHWKAIREEENEAESGNKAAGQYNEEILEEETPNEGPGFGFTPIDARHLSSLPLVKARITKLLKASKNYIHESNNILITLGFSNPTKTDRRFFQSRIRELIQQGIIEKVVVPSSRKKTSNATVKCFRLVTSENKPEGISLDVGIDEDRAEIMDEAVGVRMNATIHKQILDLLEESQTRGMTLSELSTALSNFDKRTIELLLARADNVLPPPHLSDLGIVGLMETSGRERRHRYYTIAAYRRLIAQEQLDEPSAGHANVDFAKVGCFAAVNHDLFYEDQGALIEYQDAYKANAASATNRRKKPPKNPILPDGTVKQGRPRKHPPKGEDVEGGDPRGRSGVKRKIGPIEDPGSSAGGTVAKKRRTDKDESDQLEPPAAKRRGRPPKNKTAQAETGPSAPARVPPDALREVASISPVVSKKRGRPPKKRPVASDATDITAQQPKRRKGLRSDDLVPQHTGAIAALEPPPATTKALSIAVEDLMLPVVTGTGRSPEVEKVTSDRQATADFTETLATGQTVRGKPVGQHDDALSAIQGTSVQNVITNEADALVSLPQDGTIPIGPALLRVTYPGPALSDPLASMPGNVRPTTARNRVNVSHFRRESEFHRVIEDFGGIINTQAREFYNAHTALLETLTKAGEPTSAPPGTRTDKRTAAVAFDALEARGKVKQLKTSIQTHTGVNRPARIVYLPHVTEAQLKDYLVELSRSLQPVPQTASFVKIDERLEYGAGPATISRGSLPLQLLQMELPKDDKKERWSKNIARANQLFSYDDETIREVLLAERTTLGQLYGFIVGRMARVRELHLLALRAFELSQLSINIISKEHKIIEISFFCHDLPLSHYSSLVSCLVQSDELSTFFSTEQGRQTPVHHLPPQLHSSMQIGRSRARSRFLDMLEVLRSLHIATPLRPSESDNPWIVCAANGNNPTKFDQAPLEGWTTSTPLIAPSYWKFNNMAPVHAWRESETSPPFLKNMATDTVDSARQFWETLHAASVRASVYPNCRASSTAELTSVNISLARSLRRPGSWNSRYVLTWHQMQFLKQFTDIHSAQTPLEEPDESEKNSLMERVCRVVSAPNDAVVTFYRETRARLLRELDKARQKEKRPNVERRAQRAAEVKELLAKKAAEARKKREQEWDALLLRVHPDPLSSAVSTRVKRVQKRFLEAVSTQTIEQWGSDIANAIREADIAKRLKILNKPSANLSSMVSLPPFPPPPAVLNPAEPSVQSLIAKQGTPLPPKEPQKKRKKAKDTSQDGENNEVQNKASRRHRFQWNRDYDELARDAAAIIRARCRGVARVDWAAFEQVFPAVPRNTVRQRLAHIRESSGNEAYMNRLEDKWCELWMQHRGTPLLPDDDPQNTSNFDLAIHIEFLRKHIDKNALRVGYVHTREGDTIVIPPTVEELLDKYEVDVTESFGLTWDFMWNANVEEGREKRLMRQAFVKTIETIPSPAEISAEPVALAEAALRMTLSVPNERYEVSQGAMILQSIGQKNVEAAARGMIDRGVLSKLIRDPQKLRPGRRLKISDMNFTTIGGSIPGDTFQRAVAMEEAIAQDDAWHEWSLIAKDGASAALVELVSENRLDFRIDTTGAQAARLALDWNSKKADDDQTETAVFYRRVAPWEQIQFMNEDENRNEWSPDFDKETGSEHGVTELGEEACCRLTSKLGPVDCATCLRNELSVLDGRSDPSCREVLHRVLQIIENTGRNGITTVALQGIVGAPKGNLLRAVQQLTTTAVPLVYYTGYASSVLVSAQFTKHWSVKISASPIRRIFPRRWLDTEGCKIGEYWEAALRAVLGLVIFRPGISKAEIRWRLRLTYDRQEVQEITQHLLKEGFLSVGARPGQGSSQDVTLPLGDHDERKTLYFTGSRRWYQV